MREFFGDTDKGLFGFLALRYFVIVKGFELSVVFEASDGGDIKGTADVVGAAFGDDVIAPGFAGLVDLREESDVTDEVFAVRIGAAV